MTRIGKSMASAIVSLSLIVGSTAAAASTQAVAPAAATPVSNGWMTLSMLTPASASVLGGSSAVAPQPEGPPPPPPPGYYSRSGTPPLPVIIVWLATIGVFIYIITKGNSSHRPNSPF